MLTPDELVNQVVDANALVSLSAGKEVLDVSSDPRPELQGRIAQQLIPAHGYIRHRGVGLPERPFSRPVAHRDPVGSHVVKGHCPRRGVLQVANELSYQPSLFGVIYTLVSLDNDGGRQQCGPRDVMYLNPRVRPDLQTFGRVRPGRGRDLVRNGDDGVETVIASYIPIAVDLVSL